MNKHKVISGFPGVGKSWLVENQTEFKVTDSDSSTFPKDNFPQNYIEHIKYLISDPHIDLVLVSSHQEVRDALRKEGIEYLLVHPDKSLKQEYLLRYIRRGSPEGFVKLIDKMWDEWMIGLDEDPSTKLILDKGEYMGEMILSE